MDVTSGYGCKEVYIFSHFYLSLYTPLVFILFCSSIPSPCSLCKKFFHFFLRVILLYTTVYQARNPKSNKNNH